MTKRSIQGYVELASGLGELTRSRAKEAAREIVALAGVDGSRKKVTKQASQLADELLKAAESNRKHLVRLVRREVESALARLDVNRLAGDVQNLGATVSGLAAQVDELARAASGRGTRTPGPVASALADLEPEPARVATPSSGTPAGTTPARKATTTSAAATSPTPKSSAARSSARKAPAKKAPAKKSSASGGTASTAAARKTSTSPRRATSRAATG